MRKALVLRVAVGRQDDRRLSVGAAQCGQGKAYRVPLPVAPVTGGSAAQRPRYCIVPGSRLWVLRQTRVLIS